MGTIENLNFVLAVERKYRKCNIEEVMIYLTTDTYLTIDNCVKITDGKALKPGWEMVSSQL